jgi:mycofactocin precursor
MPDTQSHPYPGATPAVALAEPERPEPEAADDSQDELVVSDLLVEDVSIDGMCGVY